MARQGLREIREEKDRDTSHRGGLLFPSHGFPRTFPHLLTRRLATKEEPRQGRDVSDLSRVEKIQFKMAAQI